MNFYKLDPIKQREITINRLLKYIKEYVYPYHPYYRRKYKELGIDVNKLKTYEDFTKLPIIEKKDYSETPKEFVLQPTFLTQKGQAPYDTAKLQKKHLIKHILQAVINYPKDFTYLYRKCSFKEKIGRRIAREYLPIHFHTSTDSIGNLPSVSYTYYELHTILPELTAAIYTQPDKISPDRKSIEWGSTVMNLFPGIPHLVFFEPLLTKLFTGLSCFESGSRDLIPPERQIELFHQNKFRMLLSTPSYLVWWLHKALSMKKEGKIGSMNHLLGCIVTGEAVSLELKEYIKELAKQLEADKNFIVLESYAITESKWVFHECQENSKIHLNPKYFLWEIVDKDTLKPVKDGEEGLLLFSHIGWRGTVFIRYNTGDLIRGGIRHERCDKCSYAFVKLYPPIMDYEKDFTTLKGTKVALLDLIESIRTTEGVRNFQVVLTREDEKDEASPDILTLHILPKDNIDKDKLTDLLNRKIKSVTTITPDRIVYETDAVKFEQNLFKKYSIKAEYIIDKRIPT